MGKGNRIPTAIFHGITDGCAYTSGKRNERLISEGTGGYVKCINVGLPLVGNLFDNFHSISQKACMKIIQDENFDGEFNILGYSQGGLISRYIVENCEMKGKVRNLITLGTPHMGVNYIPYCPPGSNVLCEWLNKITKYLVYYTFV
jgi:triacylglycerol esterase/lipase EstA (alpha/beta hydrolase family)